MAVAVTLHLPEHLVEHAKRFGVATQRDVGQVLTDTLEMLWATIGTESGLETPIATLTDADVLALADAKWTLHKTRVWPSCKRAAKPRD